MAKPVIFYKHNNFDTPFDGLDYGSYPRVTMEGVQNDTISSLKVADGVKLMMYEHYNYDGAVLTIIGPKELSSMPGPWNDRVSSVIIKDIRPKPPPEATPVDPAIGEPTYTPPGDDPAATPPSTAEAEDEELPENKELPETKEPVDKELPYPLPDLDAKPKDTGMSGATMGLIALLVFVFVMFIVGIIYMATSGGGNTGNRGDQFSGQFRRRRIP